MPRRPELLNSLTTMNAHRTFHIRSDHVASGSLLSRALSERVRARMCSNLLLATYGSTEISPVAAAAAHKIADIKGAVGYLAPWVSAQSVDDANRPLGAGLEGRIRMRSHTCVDGYLGNAEESQKFFQDGWFYPGDLGMITEDRLLVITGRENAVINLGGDKVNPETIEAVLASFPGVLHAAAFGRPDDLGVERIWAFVTGQSNLISTRSLGTAPLNFRHCLFQRKFFRSKAYRSTLWVNSTAPRYRVCFHDLMCP